MIQGLKRKDFLFLRTSGKKFYSNDLVFIFSTDKDYLKLAISIGKKHYIACKRNKIRRRIREIFRKESLQGTIWCMLHKKIPDYSFVNLKNNVEKFINFVKKIQ